MSVSFSRFDFISAENEKESSNAFHARANRACALVSKVLTFYLNVLHTYGGKMH